MTYKFLILVFPFNNVSQQERKPEYFFLLWYVLIYSALQVLYECLPFACICAKYDGMLHVLILYNVQWHLNHLLDFKY